MLQKTEFPAIWRVLIDRSHTSSPFDPVLETALLRHCPTSVMPVSWFAEHRRSVIFTPECKNWLSITELFSTLTKNQETGLQLLERILLAVDEAYNFLFTVKGTTLCPELIFFDPETSFPDLVINVIALPCHGSLCYEEDSNPLLIDVFAQHFHWDDALADQLRTLYMRNEFSLLLHEVLALNGKSKTELYDSSAVMSGPASALSHHQERKDNRFGWGFSRLIASIKSIFLSDDENHIHESTKDLDLAGKKTRIAQLSEGLPGTPEEEYGKKAYILTDEFLIGRDIRDVDLCLDSQAISRKHARIFLKSGNYFLEDLGSSNGTSLDGIRLNRKKEYLLPHKCRIAFADEHFYFRSE